MVVLLVVAVARLLSPLALVLPVVAVDANESVPVVLLPCVVPSGIHSSCCCSRPGGNRDPPALRGCCCCYTDRDDDEEEAVAAEGDDLGC